MLGRSMRRAYRLASTTLQPADAAAYDAGDFHAIQAMYADDAISVVSTGLVVEGHAAVRALPNSRHDGGFTSCTIDTT